MTEALTPDRRDLIQQVFADITSALEVAHAFASTGQSHGLSPREYRRCAKRLQTAARDVGTLAAALPVLICPTSDSEDKDGGE
jgi:hypothetical protein